MRKGYLQTEDDILVREELEEVAKESSDQFKLWYTLDRPSPGKLCQFRIKFNWAGSKVLFTRRCGTRRTQR